MAAPWLPVAMLALWFGGRQKKAKADAKRPGPPGVPAGAFTPEPAMQKPAAVPAAKPGTAAARKWRVYSPTPAAVVARARQILADRSIPGGENVTEPDPTNPIQEVQYRKRRQAGKMNVFAFVRSAITPAGDKSIPSGGPHPFGDIPLH